MPSALLDESFASAVEAGEPVEAVDYENFLLYDGQWSHNHAHGHGTQHVRAQSCCLHAT